MNYAAIDTYLKDLCVRHKQLLHNDIDNVVYIPLLSNMEVGSVDTNQAQSLVLFENLTASPAGTADDPKYIQEITLTFLCHRNSANPIAEETKEKLSKAFDIMMDFITRMRVDYDMGNCAALRGLHTSMFWKALEDEQIVNSVGWELRIKITIAEPAYNAANWN